MITGAASGFGRELAYALAQRGASLVLTDINESGLAQTCTTIAAAERLCALAGDVADEHHARALVNLAVQKFKRLDIAVNNAGVAPQAMQSIIDTDAEVMDEQFAINTKGVLFGMKHQIRHMLGNGNGVVLNVSSMAGIGGAPMLSSYVAAKHAVVGLTRTAAVEFGPKNIRINAICPFFTLTPMVDNPLLNPENSLEQLNETLAARCPLRRIARAEEVVAIMLMMISPGNTYMNGAAIPVDGGFSAM